MALAACSSPINPVEFTSFEIEDGSAAANAPVIFRATFENASEDALCTLDVDGDNIAEYQLEGCTSPLVLDHTYAEPGQFRVQLTVVSRSGTARTNLDLSVGAALVSSAQAATAVLDRYSVARGKSLAVTLPSGGLLGNDQNASGYVVKLISKPRNAKSLRVNPDGTFTYTPMNRAFAVDIFTYQLVKGNLRSNIASVQLMIDTPGVNDAPAIAFDSTPSTVEGASLSINMYVNDVDADSGDLSVKIALDHGRLTLNGTSGLSFSQGDGNNDSVMAFSGTLSNISAALFQATYVLGGTTLNVTLKDYINVTVNDQGNSGTGGAKTTSGSTYVIVSPSSAIANPDTYTVESEHLLNPDADSGVLHNDSRLGSDGRAQIVAAPLNAETFELNPNGSFNYTSKAGFVGPDTFTYRVTKGNKLVSNTTTVTIDVTPRVNHAPVLDSNFFNHAGWYDNCIHTNEDTPLYFNNIFTATDEDASSSALLKVMIEAPVGGTIDVQLVPGITMDTTYVNKSQKVAFTGNLESINVALRQFSFVPSPDWNSFENNGNSCHIFTIVLDDQGNSGTGGPKVDIVNVPVYVIDQGEEEYPVDISTGENHSCLLTNKGQIYCWGKGYDGQLGTGGTDNEYTPQKVKTLSLPTNKVFVALELGSNHTCATVSATTTDAVGRVYCWGLSDKGQVGDATGTSPILEPIATLHPSFSQFSAGGKHTCAFDDEGVYCWGYGNYGQLGNNSSNDEYDPTMINPESHPTFTTLSAGSNHTCALAEDGQAYCWGLNDKGQVGNSTETNADEPAEVDQTGLTRPFVEISAGGNHTCAVDNDTYIYCWGNNEYGQLGDMSTTNFSYPVMVDATIDIELLKVSAGGNHTCAIEPVDGDVDLGAFGSVWCWGNNAKGQIGINGAAPYYNDVQEVGFADGVPFGVPFYKVSAGGNHTCAIDLAHRVWCWGYNYHGQLGNGGTTNQDEPVMVSLPVNLRYETPHVAPLAWPTRPRTR